MQMYYRDVLKWACTTTPSGYMGRSGFGPSYPLSLLVQSHTVGGITTGSAFGCSLLMLYSGDPVDSRLVQPSITVHCALDCQACSVPDWPT